MANNINNFSDNTELPENFNAQTNISKQNLRNIKLLIAYDGTDFSGWQRQDGGCFDYQNALRFSNAKHLKTAQTRTVQGVIEQALEKMHGQPINLTGSGRTDTGVHAAGQTANFYTNIESIPANRFVPALNALLPQDVRVLEAEETEKEFHSRFSAKMRTYRYYFVFSKDRPALPTERRYNLHLWRFPRIETLNAYGRLLLGETDCSIFAAAGDPSKSKNRYIYKAHFFIERDRLIFEICANAFLRKMVRSITGTFLHYEEKGAPPENLREIISTGERSLSGPTLPPQGLFLWKVDY